MSGTEIRIKRAAALRLLMRFQDDQAQPIDLATVTLTCQVRDAADTLVAVLPVVRAATLGMATVEVADTSTWPVGRLRADIKAVVAGVTVISETFAIVVGRAVTQ